MHIDPNAPAPDLGTPLAAPAASTTPPDVTTPPKLSASEMFAKASPEQRAALLAAATGRGTPVPPAAAETTQTPAAPASEPAPVPGSTPQASAQDPTSGDDDDDSQGAPKRFRFNDPESQAIAMIAKARGVSIAQATDIYRGTTPAAEPAAKDGPAAPTPQVDPVIVEFEKQQTTLSEQIKKLTADRKAAREDLDADKADELSDAIADAKAELKLIEDRKSRHLDSQKAREEASKAQEEAQARQAVSESRDRAYARFPLLGDPNSPHHLALLGYIGEVQRDQARAGFFEQPNWPEKIADEYANKYGVAQAGQPTKTPQGQALNPKDVMAAQAMPGKPQIRQVTGQPAGARMVTPAGGLPPAQTTLTKDAILEKLRTDPEARMAIVRNLRPKT